MQLDAMLARGKRLEERAAMLYRSYAAASQTQPSLCALWTSLAREEEDHARSIVTAREHLEATAGWRTWIEGWETGLAEVDERLTAGEQLGPEATVPRQLSTALELEMSELEGFRRVLLAACRQPEHEPPADHALRLADAAEQLSDDPQVRLQAALLKARRRL